MRFKVLIPAALTMSWIGPALAQLDPSSPCQQRLEKARHDLKEAGLWNETLWDKFWRASYSLGGPGYELDTEDGLRFGLDHGYYLDSPNLRTVRDLPRKSDAQRKKQTDIWRERSFAPEEIAQKIPVQSPKLSKKTLRSFPDLENLWMNPTFMGFAKVHRTFKEALTVCDHLIRYFSLPCGETYSRSQVEQAYGKLKEIEHEFDDDEFDLVLRTFFVSVTPRAEPPLLFKWPSVIVRSESELTVPVMRGRGFPDDLSWKRFFEMFKEANERFWQGEILRVTLEEGRTDQHVLVSLGPATAADESYVDHNGIEEIIFGGQVARSILGVSEFSEQERMVLVHEFGHVLGFSDTYYPFIDMDACRIGVRANAQDIMSGPDTIPTIRAKDLKALHDTYIGESAVDLNDWLDELIDQRAYSPED